MAIKKINTDLQIEAGLRDGDGDLGANNQVLISTGTGINWVDGSATGIIGGPYLPLTGGTLSGNLTITKSSATMKVSEAGGGDIRMVAGGATGYIGTYNNNSVQIVQNQSAAIFIDTSKNVGIGTTSPSAKLEVSDSGINTTAPTIRLTNSANYNANNWGGNVSHRIEFYSSDPSLATVASSIENIAGFDKGGLLTGNLVFKTRDYPTNTTLSEKMRIAEDGNVGIGTTAPEAKLEIKKGSSGLTSVNSQADALFLQSSSSTGITIATPDANKSGIFFSSASRQIGARINWGYSDLLMTLGTATANASLALKSGNESEAVRILSNGNVGIGTTTPSEKLDVAGNAIVRGDIVSRDTYPSIYVDHSGTVMGGIRADATNKLELKTLTTAPLSFQVNSSEKMRILDNGNIGIGTTSPGNKLDVVGNISTSTNFIGDNVIVNKITAATSGGNIKFRSNDGADKVVITNSGNVGIGTTSPSLKLDINSGTANSALRVLSTDRFTGIRFEDATNNDTLFYDGLTDLMYLSSTNFRAVDIYATGNVGIGTTTPTHKLDVAGTGNFTGLVSGITPVAAANFVTKAYVDGTGGGVGPFLPLAGGTMTGTNGVIFPDNFKLNIGTSSDLQIYHDGSNSYITDVGTGNLNIKGGQGLALFSSSDEFFLYGDTNGQVNLYHNGLKKLETTSGGVEVTGKGTSSATISSDGSSTLTTKGYVDGLITGATIYRGAWDPSGGGYGSPDLSGVTQTSGYYYICSAAGTAEPNGTGTEPDTWAVGDWVIYNDVSGTGQWQKIDNSSVLSGVGTGQTVALWQGAGSVTDSETLGNAPITVSGNDTTFAGDVLLDDGTLTVGANAAGRDVMFRGATSGAYFMYDASEDGVVIVAPTDEVALGIRVVGTAQATVPQFTVGRSTSQYLGIKVDDRISSVIHRQDETDAGTMQMNQEIWDSGTGIHLWNWKSYDGSGAGGTTRMTLNKTGELNVITSVTSTTFLGDLNGTINTATTGVTQTAGDDSTKIATTAYADAAAAAIPIANYLPLSAGSSYPLTGVLYIGGTIRNSSGDLEIRNQTATGFATATKLKQQTVNGLETFLTFDGTTRAAYFSNQGKVGIGTTTPTAKLQVEDSISNGSLFKITTSAAGTLQPIFDARAVANGDTHYDFNSYKSSTKKIQIISANTASITQIDGSGGFNLKGHLSTSLQTVNGGGVLQLHRYGALSLNDDDAYAHTPSSALYINTFYNTSTDYLLLIANQGSDKLVVDLNGNVGIGTTNPERALHVVGTGRAILVGSNNAVNIAKFYNTATTNSTFKGLDFVVNSTAAAMIKTYEMPLTFGTSNSAGVDATERMRITPSGNVGIGTTSPSEKLSVSGNILAQDSGVLAGVGGDKDGFIFHDLYTGSGNYYGYKAFTGGNTRLSIVTDGTERLTVLVGGNVGIGTTSPSEKLDVRGNVHIEASSPSITLKHTSGFTQDYSITNQGDLTIEKNGVDGGGSFIIKDENDRTPLDVSMGLISPDIVVSGNLIVKDRDGTTTNLYVNENNGNVGIGTTVPTAKLQIDSTSGWGVFTERGIKDGSTSTYSHSFGAGNAHILGRDIYFESSAVFSTSTADATTKEYRFSNASDKLTVKSLVSGSTFDNNILVLSGSNVGIGTSSPTEKLEVDGYARVTALGINAAPDSYLSSLNARLAIGGNIVINTASPLLYLRANGGTTISDIKYQNSLKLTNGSGSTHLTISNGGYVGIGITNNTTIPLHVEKIGTAASIIKVTGSSAQIEIQTATAGDATLYMRPNSTGNQAAAFKMTAGTIYNWRWQDDASTPVVFMKLDQNPGTLTVKGDVIAYGSPSDKKLKENIKPIESALDKVTKLQGVTFDWKESDSILDIKEDIGFIAQDVQKVVPELVRENKDGMLSMRHQGITPILLEAIKELKAEIDLLKSKPCTCNKCNCNI